MAKKPEKQVSLPRLPIFKKFSLAVRQEMAAGKEVLATLKASVAAVEAQLEAQEQIPNSIALKPAEPRSPEPKSERPLEEVPNRRKSRRAKRADHGDASRRSLSDEVLDAEPRSVEDDDQILPFEAEMRAESAAREFEEKAPDTAAIFFGEDTQPQPVVSRAHQAPAEPEPEPKPKPKRKPRPKPQPQIVRVEDFLRSKGAAVPRDPDDPKGSKTRRKIAKKSRGKTQRRRG